MENRQWLKVKRLDKKMTHDEVAKVSGIERAYYTMIEQGKRRPSVQVAKAIANSLDFDWVLFFNEKCNESLHLDCERCCFVAI